MAIPIFSILLIVLTVLLFVKDFFYKPLIIAKREGAKYKVLWKESFELFFKHYFVFYLIVAVSTNLGYFIQVPNLLKLNDFVMLVVLTILCIIKIFQGRFNKKILFIGLLLIGSILIGLVLFAIFPYTKPLIYDIDEFVSGQEYRQYIPTIGMGIKEAIFLVVKYVLVLSVCSYEFKTKKGKKEFQNSVEST